jgi:hypothetical protein
MVANHPGMSDQTSGNIARDGAAKHPQTSFPVKGGMKDQTDASKLRGIAEVVTDKGTREIGFGFNYGPDASSPNPLDPSPKVKKFGAVKASWDMKDANGDGVSNETGGQVLSEAALLGR